MLIFELRSSRPGRGRQALTWPVAASVAWEATQLSEAACTRRGSLAMADDCGRRASQFAGTYWYTRVGYGGRPLELREDGTIGLGAAGCERTWHPRIMPDGNPAIFVYGDTLTFKCVRSPAGIWRGKWLVHEQSPVELVPYWRTATVPRPSYEIFADIYVPDNLYSRDYKSIIRGVSGDCREYRLYEIPFPDRINVIDVGAHIGGFVASVRRRHPSPNIACVEACPNNWAALAANVDGIAKRYACAVWYGVDFVYLRNVFNSSYTTAGSQTIPPAISETGDVIIPPYVNDMTKIPTITLEQIADDCQMSRVDILKLDCEGCEFNVIPNAFNWIDNNVAILLAEIHDLNRWNKDISNLFNKWLNRIFYRNGNLVSAWFINPKLVWF